MLERSPYAEGANVYFSAAVCAIALCAGLIWVGPGRSFSARTVEELDRKLLREAQWLESAPGLEVSADERRAPVVLLRAGPPHG